MDNWTTPCIVLRWNGTQWRSLMASPPAMAYPKLDFLDSGHGTRDLVLAGGLQVSVGAGPQRARREVYRWNGTVFTLTETTYAPSNFLYFKIVDANQQMLAKRYADAIPLYQDAITNPKLDLWGNQPTERADLQAFARFRIIVVWALLGDRLKAQAARDDLLKQQPAHVYAQVAKTFWDAYAPQKDVSAGCKAVTAFAQRTQAVAAILADFGYANPPFKTEDVCPF